MTDLLPLEQRPVAKFARKVDGGQLLAAMGTLKLKYAIPQTGLDVRGLPTHDVSSEALFNSTTKMLMCGGTHPNRTFTLFEPGLHARARRGFSLRLSVLETTLHETFHTANGEKHYPGTYTDEMSTEECGRTIGGFREVFYMDGEATKVHNNLFNEGVTQLLTLELMREYLILGPYLNVTPREWKKHFFRIHTRKRGSFYPDATSFVQAFVSRVAVVIGSEKVVWDKLYQDYFLGTSLLNDTFWAALIREAGIERIMRATRTAHYNSLPTYEAQIRKNRGAWEKLEAVPALRPAYE
ncbi:MAG: hypothetical protein JWM46_265 [Candidatus Kaiserbacteria bacterium]|nr:hypothetical protein [Candidatus Kaiserbacteria bacterium]